MDTSIVTLQFSKKTKQVKAVVDFTSGETNTVLIDDAWIQNALKENDFDNYFILEGGISDLKNAVQGRVSTTIAIAEKRDAVIDIIVTDNNMHTYLSITPPFGGKAATVEDVIVDLEAAGIKYGIDQAAVRDAVHQGQCTRVLVAAGAYPVDGENAYFKVLVAEEKRSGPTIDENGVANFLAVTDLTIVHQGDPLMRKVPRTLGTNGYDVLGNLIYASPGKNVKFASTLNGAVVSKYDSNLLEAAIQGHPIVESNNVRVDPTYVVDKVDMTTGHIDFDGSVLVKGDVESNMKVVATGDITINGCVIKAIIESGGRLVINQGIIGGDLIKNPNGVMQRGSIIKSTGTLTTSFIDNSNIEVHGNILVKDYIANSDVASGGDIIVGSTGYKGYIVGGCVTALHLISANVLGSSTQNITKIKVGTSLTLAQTYERKLQKLQENELTLAALGRAFIEIGKRESEGSPSKKTKQILASLVQTLQAVAPTIRPLTEETQALKARLGEFAKSKVKVRERVFSGVELNLNEKIYNIEKDMVGGAFELINGEVTISPIGR